MLISIFVLVLVCCVCECMVLMTDIENGIRKPTCGHQNCNPSLYMDIWWACQGGRIFVYHGYYLGQHHSTPY